MLSDYEADLSEDDRLPFDAILVTGVSGEDGRSVSIELQDAPDSAPSFDPDFHNNDVKTNVTITDKWFEVYQGIPDRAKSLFEVEVTDPQGSAATGLDLQKLETGDFVREAGTDTWTATYTLPRSASSDKPFEGTYDVTVSYEGCAGDGSAISAEKTFSVDVTGPALGTLTFDPASPSRWGWILPSGVVTMGIDVADSFSGIDEDAFSFTCPGIPDAPVSYEGGAFSVRFDRDGSRMIFANASISAHDRAGNYTTVDSLANYLPSNIPAGCAGIAIDTEAPLVDVSFDNNDVRNGRYYNAGRQGVVTITESNFDIGRDNAPDTVIATVRRDGGSTEVRAKDFTNPSGDGRTWVAGIDCGQDGDYTVDVSYADPAGHAAAPWHDEFTVDTQAPRVMVMFDNNDAQNGSYFKAPRTATVTVSERNFAQSADVATTASESSGGTAAGPGPSSWTDGAGGDTHECTVYFGDELHYTLTASCTDLAGNVGETVKVDEFIIDMTPPVASIGGVDDHAAYAGEVMPTVTFEDTNFNPTQATYTLTGAKGGDVWMLNVAEEVSATGENVRYPDFDHVLERDDVYTLDATVADLAGNTASDQRTFSVNRFGSNYVLMDGTDQIEGAYINQPRDVTVAEINVSGLDESKTHAEITHDSRQESLVSGSDYTTETVPDAGWSETRYRFPARLFDADGYYRVFLTSTDLAGNLSQNTVDDKNENRDGEAVVDFAVDMTSPETSAYGVESGRSYLSPSLDMQVDAWDNLGLDKVALEVDGDEVVSWDGADASEGLKDWSLASDNSSHRITLTAVDRAGNVTRQPYDDVFVATDWIAYLLNTPAVLYPTIVGIIGVIAALGTGIVLGRRHSRATEARRNPFGRG
ncbi:MAG: Ig-like domain-containing protein [Coriobacteriales bacterium]